MIKLGVHKNSITELHTDAVVNAANSGLRKGSGVCGFIFAAAGADVLEQTCKAIGYCETGRAVVTPAFGMKNNKYIVHAVGPDCRIADQKANRQKLLYHAYYNSLVLAEAFGCKSIGFPLISTGVYGYPEDEAWHVSLQACLDFGKKNPQSNLDIVIVCMDRTKAENGKAILKALGGY